ncbi:MAG: hypothetical protein LBD49_01495, partial [Oscillospiraceae bacterium]|nr:hypothetical protein [Oscillospiraceae bacterium]
MKKIVMNKKALAIVLAVVMAVSLFAVSVNASGPANPDYEQDVYLWWFGRPGSTPEFQQAPMGDDAIIGYDMLSASTTRFYFEVITVGTTPGYISSIIVNGRECFVPYDPDDPYAGGYADLPTPYNGAYPGYMLQIDYLGITLIGSEHPVDL